MKILHVATGFPLSFQGGITNYVRALAESQYSEGNDVWVLGSEDGTRYSFNYYTYQSKKIPPFTLGDLVDTVGLTKISEFLAEEKFDIIHLHMVLGMDWDLYKVIMNYNYIVSLHDYYYICPRIQMIDKSRQLCSSYDQLRCQQCISYIERFKVARGIVKYIRKIDRFRDTKFFHVKQKTTLQRYERFKLLLKNAKYVLPVSNRVMEIYKKSGIEANYKVMYIGNISANHFKENYRIDLSERKIKIVVLGSLTYYKGGDVLVQIARKLSREKYEIHFYGRPLLYERQLQETGIINHGPYQQDNLSNILDNADLGFVLSVWEDNGPQVVMEFLNNRVPVIGTKMGGIIDFINRDNGYLFNPYSVSEIESLINFLENLSVEDINVMKSNIKRTTTPQEHSNLILDLYAEVLKN